MAQIFYEPSGCNCGGKTNYTRADINNAATKALQLAQQGQTIGSDKYPHAYNDYENFNFSHAMKPYLEFPIETSDKTYDGSSPGADRVVIGSIAADYSSAVYCAVITHDGEKDNGFAECKDTTMNLRGKGSDVKASKDHDVDKRAYGHGRALLDKIEL